jgi:predicted helicase
MYAQTLVYGLFAARYNDPTPDSFSRAEARDLLPATNPFLKSFFDHITGASFPRRLEIIVDELCEVFTHADVRQLMEEYFKQATLAGGEVESPDPVIHFYEDFLREYDPQKKVDMGVFYTPLPVVRFIVRGIDDLLQREFRIHDGLADTEQIERTVVHQNDKGKDVKETVSMHRVQLLDVAVGTGTFLNEAVRHIHSKRAHNQGNWPAYVNDSLLPRLHGFELMMASYTIAHLKLALTLRQTGAEEFTRRLGVYLSNTLDAPQDVALQADLFGVVNSIAEESRLASEVKRERPIMVVLGNPPYSGISQNKHYTDNDAYKVEPGGGRLQERKHWLDDDYVKFIRFAETLVAQNGEGVIGMITAHGYLDNPTFRGMRWQLRQTFDAIYVLDLHGNANKKETAPDGSEDKNVFDIKTGVAIIFGVKKATATDAEKGKGRGRAASTTPPQKSARASTPPARVHRADLYGKRAHKFNALDTAATLADIDWVELPADCEAWVEEGAGKAAYQEGFSVAELFPQNTTGIVTARDSVVIDVDREALVRRITTFAESDQSELELRQFLFPGKKDGKYPAGDTRGWKLMDARQKIRDLDHREIIKPISYRPFDTRYCYYHPDMVDWGRWGLMEHFLAGENVGLVFRRQQPSENDLYVFCSDSIISDGFIRSDNKGSESVAPLYLCENGERIANLDSDIVAAIEGVVGTTTPEDVLDYVYAVLHSPRYRATYAEFLKSSFPRVPYPGGGGGKGGGGASVASAATDQADEADFTVTRDQFWGLVECGRRLRGLHLLTDPAVRRPVTTFPVGGDNVADTPRYDHATNRIYLNPDQYWEGVPESVWNFYIGGYQPAQKYLKDRKGRALTAAEFENYERLLVSLHKTMEVMQQIDETW